MVSIRRSYGSYPLPLTIAKGSLTESQYLPDRNTRRDGSVGPDHPEQSSSVSDDSSLPLEYTSNRYKLWCFICGEPSVFITSAGYKKHVQEHDTRWYCIPPNSIRHTESGPKCAFCNVLNPDTRHCNIHSDYECVGKCFKRKQNLAKHLERAHKVDDGLVLAEQSMYIFQRKFFSCGFCVSCFKSRTEQLAHIDRTHYRVFLHIRAWDPRKVIQGLLEQPVVNELWQSALAASSSLQESWSKWDPLQVEELQERLELSREPAAVLFEAAIAAIDQSNRGRNVYDQIGPTPITDFIGREMDNSQHRNRLPPLIPTLEQDSSAQSAPETAAPLHSQPQAWGYSNFNNSDRNQVYEDRPLPQTQTAPETAAPLHSQPRAWGSSDSNNSIRNQAYEDRPLPRIAAETYRLPVSAMHHPLIYPPQRPSSLASNEISSRQQRAAYPLPASGTPPALERLADTSSSPRLAGNPPGAPPSVTTDTRSRQAVGAPEYPSPAHAHRLDPPTLPAPIARSPLPHNQRVSPYSRPSTAYSPGYRSASATRRSRQGPTSGRDIETDVDSNDKQRQSQDKDHRRNRK